MINGKEEHYFISGSTILDPGEEDEFDIGSIYESYLFSVYQFNKNLYVKK